MKVYPAACPVCHAATELVAEFWSTSFYTRRSGPPFDNTSYPSVPCPGLHTLAEVRAAMGLPVRPYEDPNGMVAASGARLVAPPQATLPFVNEAVDEGLAIVALDAPAADGGKA